MTHDPESLPEAAASDGPVAFDPPSPTTEPDYESEPRTLELRPFESKNRLKTAESLSNAAAFFDKGFTAAEALHHLRTAFVADGDAQDVLFGHIQVLDCLFHRGAIEAVMVRKDDDRFYPSDILNPDALDLALRLQRQCRQSIQALHLLRGGIGGVC